jgi:hypothetical protein
MMNYAAAFIGKANVITLARNREGDSWIIYLKLKISRKPGQLGRSLENLFLRPLSTEMVTRAVYSGNFFLCVLRIRNPQAG